MRATLPAPEANLLQRVSTPTFSKDFPAASLILSFCNLRPLLLVIQEVLSPWTRRIMHTLLSKSLFSFRVHNNSSFSLGSFKVVYFGLQLFSLLFSGLSWVVHSFLEEQCLELDTVVQLRSCQLWEEWKDYSLWFVGSAIAKRSLHIVSAREDKYCILNVTGT